MPSKPPKITSGYTRGATAFGIIGMLFWTVALTTGWIDRSDVDNVGAIAIAPCSILLFMGVGAVLGTFGDMMASPKGGAFLGATILALPILIAVVWILLSNSFEEFHPIRGLVGIAILATLGAVAGGLGGMAGKKERELGTTELSQRDLTTQENDSGSDQNSDKTGV